MHEPIQPHSPSLCVILNKILVINTSVISKYIVENKTWLIQSDCRPERIATFICPKLSLLFLKLNLIRFKLRCFYKTRARQGRLCVLGKAPIPTSISGIQQKEVLLDWPLAL
jgi:hypothetical protein